MDDREFWFWWEVRRWLKTRILADQQMIAAIERRYGPFGEQKRQEGRRPSPTAA